MRQWKELDGLILGLSKEFIDYYKEKWKKYRITKKQMEMAYKLLMK